MNKDFINDFLESIKDLNKQEKDIKKADRFNIFYALHKEHDEVRLHSRFISYLLDPNAGHQKGSYFAEIFVNDVLRFKYEFDFFKDYEVRPNEIDKREYEEIDILIVNRRLKKAIILENKIFAKDSNHYHKKDNLSQVGQLSRYYKVISGTDYGFRFKDNNIKMVYLTLKEPNRKSFDDSKKSIPESIKIKVIYYRQEIIKWLEKCIVGIDLRDKGDDAVNVFLKKIINQYLILVKKMINQDKTRTELKDCISNNLDAGLLLYKNFNHVKWHTVDDFLNNLMDVVRIDTTFRDAKFFPENDDDRFNEITKITHDKKSGNIGITFRFNNKHVFISSLNFLSWGIIEGNIKYWSMFNNEKINDIRFEDFNIKNTFNLINENKTTDVINTMIDEIKETVNNNYKELMNEEKLN